MKLVRAIIATNALITLPDGSREITADCALEDGATQINERGGIPTLFGHDWLRPAGWVTRAWTERDGKSLRLVTESIQQESDEEYQFVLEKVIGFLKALEKYRTAPFEDMARSLKIPQLALTFDSDCVILQSPDLVRQICPSAFSGVDGDGLITVRKGSIDENGSLRSGDFLLVPSPLFRPSFGLPNVPNQEFLSPLLRLAKNSSDCEVRVAIDPHRLAIPDSLKPSQQREYWWGPQFAGNPFDQPYGITVHGPTKNDVLNSLIRTEFWWYGKTERTFEMEELAEIPKVFDNQGAVRGMRFVHSVFHQQSKHLDGAIRWYSEDLWQERLDKKLSDFGKKARREKLWRVDGDLSIKTWYELIHMFFRGNYSVGEYFGLPNPDDYRSAFEKSLNTAE